MATTISAAGVTGTKNGGRHLGLALLAAFAVIETRSRHALLPVRLLRSRDRLGANLIMLAVGTAMFGVFFFLVLFVQDVWGYSALRTGVALLPLTDVLRGALGDDADDLPTDRVVAGRAAGVADAHRHRGSRSMFLSFWSGDDVDLAAGFRLGGEIAVAIRRL